MVSNLVSNRKGRAFRFAQTRRSSGSSDGQASVAGPWARDAILAVASRAEKCSLDNSDWSVEILFGLIKDNQNSPRD